jgi:hypothetical protein
LVSIEFVAFDYELVALLLAHCHERDLGVDTGVCQKVEVDFYAQMNSIPAARARVLDSLMPQNPISHDTVGGKREVRLGLATADREGPPKVPRRRGQLL